MATIAERLERCHKPEESLQSFERVQKHTQRDAHLEEQHSPHPAGDVALASVPRGLSDHNSQQSAAALPLTTSRDLNPPPPQVPESVMYTTVQPTARTTNDLLHLWSDVPSPWRRVQMAEQQGAWHDASDFVRNLIRHGFNLVWNTLGEPPQFRLPPYPVSARKRPLLHNELNRLVEMSVLREVEPGSSNYVSPAYLSVTEKVDVNGGKKTKLRLIFDFSHLNSFLQVTHFSEESLQVVTQLLMPGDSQTTFDISDAFLHIPASPQAQQYLRIVVDNREFVCLCAPFGLSISPWLLHELLTCVVKSFRTQGIRTCLFVDDWWAAVAQPEDLAPLQHTFLETLHSRGLRVATNKLLPLPPNRSDPHSVLYLGMWVHSPPHSKPYLRVPPEALTTLKLLATDLQSAAVKAQQRTGRPEVKAVVLRKFLGKVALLSVAMPTARLNSRALQADLGGKHGGARVPVVLSTEAIRSLAAFINMPEELAQKTVSTHRFSETVTVHTDASREGYGFVCKQLDLVVSGVWTAEQRQEHITALELRAAVEALRCVAPRIQGRALTLYSDNQVTVNVLLKGTSKSRRLLLLAQEAIELQLAHDILLFARYIPGVENVEADQASRVVQTRRRFRKLEWLFYPQVLTDIEAEIGKHNFELFASRTARALPEEVPYAALDPRDKEATVTDAFSIPWNFQPPQLVWANPPLNLAGRALHHLANTWTVGTRITLTVPQWASKYFYPLLLSLRRQARTWREFVVPVTETTLNEAYYNEEDQAETKTNRKWTLVVTHFSF